jgi:protease I
MGGDVSDRPLQGARIAVLVESLYIPRELDFYERRFTELGGEVHLLSRLWGQQQQEFFSGTDAKDEVPGTRVVKRELITADVNDYAAVLIAANYVAVRLRYFAPRPGEPMTHQSVRMAPAVEFYARAMKNPKIIKGALCHGLWLLTPCPELLKGRKIICHEVVLADILNAGATYQASDNGVVVDNDLVTGRSVGVVEKYTNTIAREIGRARARGPGGIPAKGVPRTSEKVFNALQARFDGVRPGAVGSPRPVAKAAAGLLAGSLDVAAEVKRLTGSDLDLSRAGNHKPILLVASIFGTWASELTLVVGVLLKAGYRVTVATEDGSPPHLLGPSLNPDFTDGSWRASVVSAEERDLALRFLNPNSAEHPLLRKGNVFDLSQLARPPQVGDYLEDRTLLRKYREALEKTVGLANEYDGLVIAGGSGAIPGLMFDRGLQSLILAFHDLGKPVMAECNGGLAVAQTVDPDTGRSILDGRAVTTHSWLDEYQSGWGWTQAFSQDAGRFWAGGRFDLSAYSNAEQWLAPGTGGNPLIDSEGLFKNAAGPGGLFFSPPGSPYSVVVDGNLITCRTTPDGYPGVLALMAVMDGRPPLQGRLFIDADGPGRGQP